MVSFFKGKIYRGDFWSPKTEVIAFCLYSRKMTYTLVLLCLRRWVTPVGRFTVTSELTTITEMKVDGGTTLGGPF